MPDFDDEIDAALAESPTAPRTGYGRRTVLDTVHVEGDPEGRRGRTAMGAGGRVEETGVEASPGDATPDALTRLRATEAQEGDAQRAERRRGREQRDERFSPLWDALSAPTSLGAARRTGERLSEFWDQVQEDPRAVGRAALDQMFFGTYDEMAGAMSPIPGAQRRAREQLAGDTRERPYAVAGGRAAGVLPMMVAGPIATPTTALGRLGLATAEGAAIGAAEGIGRADPDEDAPAAEQFMQRAEGGLEGGVIGGVFGAGSGVVGEGARLGMRGVEALGRGRDRALLAATGGGSGATPATRRFGSLPGGDAAAAERLRRMGVVPSVGTVSQIEQRAGAARAAAGEQIQRAFDLTEGRSIPVEDFITRLQEASSGFDRPTARGAQTAVDRMIADVQQSYPDGVPFRVAQGMIDDLRDSGAFVGAGGETTPLGRQAQQQIYRSMRGAMDDWVRELGGTEAMGTYQAARLDQQAARIAERNAREAGQRQAGNLGFGLMDTLGAGLGAGAGSAITGDPIAGAILGGAAMHGMRATQGTLRASGAELAYRIAQVAPERLGPAARLILDAGRRGSASLATAVHVLSQRDARFRQEVERALEAQARADEAASMPEAVRAISESYRSEEQR